MGEETYAAGTYVVKLDQPLRSYIKSLLEQVYYPQNEWTTARDGSPMRPYDMAAFPLAEHMGVRVVESKAPIVSGLSKVETISYPEGSIVGDGENGYLLNHNANDSFVALNRIMESGGEVFWLTKPIEIEGEELDPGAMLIKAEKELLSNIAKELHLNFHSAPDLAGSDALTIKPPRLGMYHRYQGGNMDEGWTRWLLEQFEFPYKSVMSEEIKEGTLSENYDVIILPDDGLESLIGPDYEKPSPGDRPIPPEYRSGLGEEGIEALKKFVEGGGTLIALDTATELPIEKFGLPIINAVDGLPSKEFYCPGSTLRMNFNISHPVAYGMQKKALGLFWFSPAFVVRPVHNNELYQVVAGYPDGGDLLRSGWLIGGDKLHGKASVIEASLGDGKVILFGMRPQHRAQTHGTFKLLFNSIYYGAAEHTKLQ